MQALSILEAFNILKDGLARFRAIVKRAMVREFVLERTEKAFHDGIVITTALATETESNSLTDEHRLIEPSCVLIPLVTMVQQAR